MHHAVARILHRRTFIRLIITCTYSSSPASVFRGPIIIVASAVHNQNNLPALAALSHALFSHCFLPTSHGCRWSLPLPCICSEAENLSQPSQNIWLPVWNVFFPIFLLAGVWGASLRSHAHAGSQMPLYPSPGSSCSRQAATLWIIEKVPTSKKALLASIWRPKGHTRAVETIEDFLS